MTDDVAVLDALRAAIGDGEFAAGQRLVEIDLCERFGCSRFAVRAAIPVLASEGLVELQRHRGARVRVIPLAEAIEITEVRRLLEGMTAARAAERATSAQVAGLRHVFYKGLAAAVVEALRAAEAAGCADWLREHIAAELAAADAATAGRLEQGSYQHALRRAHEMAAAAEMLGELGVPPRIARASQEWLDELAAG